MKVTGSAGLIGSVRVHVEELERVEGEAVLVDAGRERPQDQVQRRRLEPTGRLDATDTARGR